MSKYMDCPPKLVVNLAGGCCGEVAVKERFITRVNVWTVRKKMARCRRVTVSGLRLA